MSYNGGKNGSGVYQNIINCMPPHDIYIELFLGSGAILNKKRPASRNIGVEINPKVIDRYWKAPSPGKEIFQECAIEYLRLINKKDDNTRILIYADPPYPLFIRKGLNSRLYDFEMTDDQHKLFLKHCADSSHMLIISCYPNDFYDGLLQLPGWRHKDFKAQTRKGSVTERLYMNFPIPKKLHDYSFLGIDRTDRQRIKEKIRRQVLKLMKLPALERAAILEELWKIS